MRPVLLALGVGLCTAGYVTMDKFNLQHLSALSLLAIGNLGVMAALTPAALRKGKLRAEWSGRWKQTLAGAVLSPGSYLLFLLAIPYAPIGLISPIRECGTVLAAIFGVLLLKESQGFRRIIGHGGGYRDRGFVGLRSERFKKGSPYRPQWKKDDFSAVRCLEEIVFFI
ncbi:EamA family transporter [Paenibacillus sp. D51F]